MNTCQDCGKALNPRSHAQRCPSCASKARWIRPEFRERCLQSMNAARQRPDVRERHSQAIRAAMHRPETNALLRRPKSEAVRLNMRIAQNAPHLIALRSLRVAGEKNYFYGKPGTNRGKYGKDHPRFGCHHTPETRALYSIQRPGEKNPFYGKHHSLGARLKNAAAHIGKNMGPNNWRWGGGEVVDPYDRTFTDMIKNQVHERDLGICQLCGKPEGNRHHHVHHIFYNRRDRELDRLITLCVPCHKLVHKKKKIWPPILVAKIATK